MGEGNRKDIRLGRSSLEKQRGQAKDLGSKQVGGGAQREDSEVSIPLPRGSVPWRPDLPSSVQKWAMAGGRCSLGTGPLENLEWTKLSFRQFPFPSESDLLSWCLSLLRLPLHYTVEWVA